MVQGADSNFAIEYLHECEMKFENILSMNHVPIGGIVGWEQNPGWKISWHGPFKLVRTGGHK
jgi:hypothetical protein